MGLCLYSNIIKLGYKEIPRYEFELLGKDTKVIKLWDKENWHFYKELKQENKEVNNGN